MNVVAQSPGLDLEPAASKFLLASRRLWFAVAAVGQVAFAASVAIFYGVSAWRGNWLAWNRSLAHGYVAGNDLGNGALAAHLLFASLITFAGLLQLAPPVRRHYPRFHRWLGRSYVAAAAVMGATGLYLILAGRTIVAGPADHAASVINALLILFCAAQALRHARARDFVRHRRWALRLFLAVGGVWFFRVGLMFWLLVNQGPVGFDPTTFRGPFVTFLSYAQFLLPLATLEAVFRAQERPGAPRRILVAAMLSGLTLVMGAGIASAIAGLWLPRIVQGFDARISIADTLAATIAARGVDEAVRQYEQIRAQAPAAVNLDESELNNLGYALIRAGKPQQALRILQLNVAAFPKSSNASDSLAEAYLDAGDKAQAIANYRLALIKDPGNRNSAIMLQRLTAP